MTDQKDMTSNDDMPAEVFLRIHNGDIQLSDDGDPIAFRFTRTDTLNQQAPEQECTCDYTEIKMTDCPIHGLNAKKEPPADQDAVRELVKLVKAIHLLEDGEWLYGERGEAEWIAERDAVLQRLQEQENGDG